MRSEGVGAKKDATLQHVLCGECEGIPEDTRAVVKEGMATHLRMALRAMTRRDRRGAAVVARREAAVAQIGAAQRALAKGEARSTALEREAMARWLAGDLPAAGTAGEATAKEAGVAREVVAAVRAAQTVAATARAAWEKEARAEVARRAERGERGRMEVHHQVRAGGFDAWRAQARVVGEDEGGQESGEQRKGAGWTLAAMMIRYKHREVRERARQERVRRRSCGRQAQERSSWQRRRDSEARQRSIPGWLVPCTSPAAPAWARRERGARKWRSGARERRGTGRRGWVNCWNGWTGQGP